jgi:thiol-disulfide isomerase/thioredoxin
VTDDRKTLLQAVGIGALVFAVVMAFGGPRMMGGDGTSSPLVGHPAPELTADVVAGEGTGDRVSLSEQRGHVVMLDFWASWCPPCRESIPILGRVAARHPELRAYAVNVEADQTSARVEAAARALHVMMPTLHDRTYQAGQAFGVEALPTLMLVDREGIVRRVETGVPDEAQLDGWITELTR